MGNRSIKAKKLRKRKLRDAERAAAEKRIEATEKEMGDIFKSLHQSLLKSSRDAYKVAGILLHVFDDPEFRESLGDDSDEAAYAALDAITEGDWLWWSDAKEAIAMLRAFPEQEQWIKPGVGAIREHVRSKEPPRIGRGFMSKRAKS
ncbi:MAG: hypothetical protein AB7I37_25955 [Pirellulales bacterium]